MVVSLVPMEYITFIQQLTLATPGPLSGLRYICRAFLSMVCRDSQDGESSIALPHTRPLDSYFTTLKAPGHFKLSAHFTKRCQAGVEATAALHFLRKGQCREDPMWCRKHL